MYYRFLGECYGYRAYISDSGNWNYSVGALQTSGSVRQRRAGIYALHCGACGCNAHGCQ